MTTPFLDAFTDVDGTDLGSHTPTGGTAWVRVSGPSGAAVVTLNACRSRSTTVAHYQCDDQGSADQYVQAVLASLTLAIPNSYVACRLVDASNLVGWRLFGTGSSGLRLTEVVGGVATDKYTRQGVAGNTYRLEVEGTTARLYGNGILRTTQTIASGSNTRQGLRIGSDVTVGWIDDFEAGALGGGGTTVSVNQSAEADTAQAVAQSKHKAVGQVVETASAQSITPLLVGGIAEPILQVAETDAAQALGRTKSRALGQVAESDSAQAFEARKTKALGQVAESDSAQALAAAKTRALGQVAESDSAQALAARKIKALGPAAETDAAQPFGYAGVKVIALGQVTETEFAQALAAYKSMGVLQPVETDSAHAFTAVKSRALGPVAETGFAQALAAYKSMGVLQPVETDSAHAFTAVKSRALGPALETDEAMPATPAGGAQLNLSAEDIAAVAAAVWASPTAVEAHAKLDAILDRLAC